MTFYIIIGYSIPVRLIRRGMEYGNRLIPGSFYHHIIWHTQTQGQILLPLFAKFISIPIKKCW